MKRSSRMSGLILGTLLGLSPLTCLGQDAPHAALSDQTLIGANALEATQGRTAVNLAAGRGNLQANAMSLAIGEQVQAVAQARQEIEGTPALSAARDASSRIEAGAFRQAQGAISVNVVSGEFNRQANLISLSVSNPQSSALGTAAVAASDDVLLETRAGTGPGEPATIRAGQRSAHIESGAFAGASGIVQINQVAGVQNTVSNLVVIRVSGASGAL